MASRAIRRAKQAVANSRSTDERRLRDEYYGDIQHTGSVGRTLTDRFATDIQDFDPEAAFERSTGAAFERFNRNVLGRGIRDTRARQVGGGRLDTGYGNQDEDRLIEYGLEDLNREVASRALQAQGLNLDRISTMGHYGDRYADRAMGARGGEYQTLRQQRLQEESERRSGRGALVGAALGAAGTVLGGPIGGAIANRWIAPRVSGN